MRDFNWYADTAKEKNNFKSDRKLAEAMGFSQAAFHSLRHGKSKPADETMVKLATLAGVDEQTALMDVNIWRAPTPAIQKTYANILQKLTQAAMVAVVSLFIFSGLTGNAEAKALSNDDTNNIYYGKYYYIFRILKNAVLRFFNFPSLHFVK